MERFDLIIVGAGPAGSAAATAGLRAGLSVALVDKAVFPRVKLCGGLFTQRAARAMEAGFGLYPDNRFLECRDVVLRLGGQAVQARSPWSIWLTMRLELDAMLLQAAVRAGARVFQGQPVQAVDAQANTVTLRDGRSLSYRFLIGTDGVHSVVRRAVWGQAQLPRQAFALEAEVDRALVPDPDRIVIDFDAAHWGYGWAFPKQGSVTVGVGGLASRNPDMKAQMAAFAVLTTRGPMAGVKGHFLPFGGMVAQPLRGNVGLAGDAAGLVDPLTGEGIAHAIQSGSLMGQIAVAHLTGQPDNTPRAALRAQQRELQLARIVQALVLSRALPLALRQRMLASPARQERFMALLAGETSYARLLTRRIWPFGGQ